MPEIYGIFVYPDMETYIEAPVWKSDDYFLVTEKTTMKELTEHFTPEEIQMVLDAYFEGQAQ